MLLAPASFAAAAAETGPIDAVETCMAAVGPSATDDARLSADGWLEKPIDNIEKAPGGAAANRLFAKEGAGAAIMINVVTSKKRTVHHCHVISERDGQGITGLEQSLATRLGGKVLPMGKGLVFYQVEGRDIIVTSQRKPSGNGEMIDIHTMAFDVKEMSK